MADVEDKQQPEKTEETATSGEKALSKEEKKKERKRRQKQRARERKQEEQQQAEGGSSAANASASASASTANEDTQDDSDGLVRHKARKKRDEEEALAAIPHKFWDTQPVPKMGENVDDVNEPLEVKDVSEIQKEPMPLLSLFEWTETDVDDPATLEEIYTLLTENYVEDDDCMFRFDYSREFLKWALKPPGFRRDWHIGVRVKSNGKLCAFITAVPAEIRVRDKAVSMVEINFLCVHKKLRSHRLAPILIKEITRRVNLTGIFQAVYTAGVLLPKPVSKCRYYHRSLNPKKLVNVGFSHLSRRMTISRAIKLYKLPERTKTPGIRPMEERDVPAVSKLLNNYLQQFSLAPVFSEEEVAHWFLPRARIIDSYVVENPTSHKITDLASFYTLPSTIIGNPTYSTLHAAYSYYNVATSTSLTSLMNDVLILANKAGYDVFNCLDVMDNATFLKELKFGIGDGNLHYYLYNWKCPRIESQQMGLVLM
ncbi:glycylpeptide N-tetradecanoyltransferase [Balamuthia mandrillaris]